MVNSIPKAVSIGFILAIAFGIAVGIGKPPAAYAKVDGEADSYLTSTRKKLKELRTELFANLSEEHQLIESKIDYEVRPIWRTRAFARYQGGYREVILYGGLIAVMEFITDAQLVERHFASPGCFAAYFENILAIDRENTKKTSEGFSPGKIRDVFAFAEENPKSCKPVTVEHYYANQTAMAERAALLKGGVAFLMAHEAAHHVLGHVDEADPGSLVDTLADSRKLETDADNWAFGKMAETGLNPIQAFGVLMFAVATNDWAAEDEEWSTHPSGAKRFRSMLNQGKKLAANGTKFHEYLVESGQLTQWHETLKAIEATFKSYVAKSVAKS